MKKLEAGQRIELYKVLTDGGYNSEIFTVGTIRAGKDKYWNLVGVLDNQGNYLPMFHTPCEENSQEVRQVGAMIIKEVKNG